MTKRINKYELCNDYWRFMERVLRFHNVDPREIEVAAFHYKEAFLHGYKHARR